MEVILNEVKNLKTRSIVLQPNLFKRCIVLKMVMLLLAISLSGCKKNPVDRLINPLEGGSVPGSSGIYTIYDDELKTAGGLIFIPGGENQSLELTDVSSPRRNRNHARYSWNGQDVTENGTAQHLFAGFSFVVSQDAASLATTPARDLSGHGYDSLTLYVRGNLSLHTKLRIEGPDDGAGGITAARTEITSLTNDWAKVTLAVPTGDFSSIKSFFTLSFQYEQPAFTTAPGDGGVVYIDDVRYE